MTNAALILPTTPRLRLIQNAMPEDQDPRETRETMAPPTERELPTNPHPSEAPIAGPKTIVPVRTPSDFKEVAAEDVIAAQRQLQAGLDELLGPGGRLEQQTNAISAVVDAAALRQMQSYDLLRQDMLRRFELTDARDKDQDAKLETVTKAVAALSVRIDSIEKAPRLGAAYENDLREVKSTLGTILDMIETMGKADSSELAGRKVLLVDDQEILLRTLTRILASRGATVLTASTLATVKLLVQDFDPDCVVVDLRLADGEDGSVVANWLLDGVRLEPSRVLLMTGDLGPGPRALATKLQVKLIEKPMPAGDLVRVIREASNRPS